MKKTAKIQSDPGLFGEYDLSKGVRGKYAKCYAAANNLVASAPDVAEVFRDSDAVNDALRILIQLAREKAKKRHDGGIR